MESVNLGPQHLLRDSGGRLQNYKVIKQQPRPEGYISDILCRGHQWVMAALRGGCLPLHFETLYLEHLHSTFFNCLSDLDTSFTSLTPIDKFLCTFLVQTVIVKQLGNICITCIKLELSF